MVRFTDRTGRAWDLVLTFGHVEPIRDACDLDLLQLGKSEDGWSSLFGVEFRQIVSATWLLCQDQAATRSVTPEQWAYLFDHPTMVGAASALAEAVIGFFLSPEIARTILSKLRETTSPPNPSTSSESAGS